MQLIDWNNKLKLGVNVIDGQHQQLVSMINETYNALQLNNRHKINTILDELIFYAKYHLSTEEYLMNKYNFYSICEHEIAHSNFCTKVRALKLKLDANEALYHIDIVVFLKDWLMDHILVTDRELAIYLISNGVA